MLFRPQRLVVDLQILGKSDTATESCSSDEAKIYGPLTIMVGSHQQGEGAVGCLARYSKAN